MMYIFFMIPWIILDYMESSCVFSVIQPSTLVPAGPVVLQSQNLVKSNRVNHRASTCDTIADVWSCLLSSSYDCSRSIELNHVAGVFVFFAWISSWLWSVSCCSRPIELHSCYVDLFILLVLGTLFSFCCETTCKWTCPLQLLAVLCGDVVRVGSPNPWSSFWYQLRVHVSIGVTSWMNS